MKILFAHNYYQLKGGEDSVLANEMRLLKENGHKTITYFRHNQEIEQYSTLKKVGLLFNTTYSAESYQEVTALLKKERPDICHVHNFLPLITPSVYDACRDNNVPIVQTLHNFRLICTNGLFLRNGKICEDCLGKSAYGSVLKKCYRDSSLQTFAVARMIEQHKAKNTWNTKVSKYICLNQFSKGKFIEAGLPEEKLMVKPNFVERPTFKESHNKAPYFVFVGRVDSTKGIELLNRVAVSSPIPIKVIGEGDLVPLIANNPKIEYLGKRPNEETQYYIQQAEGLLFPSILYEGMPMTILEAFANKTLVIASNLGAMKAMIEHKKNGLLFEPNNDKELSQLLNFAHPKTNETEHIVEAAYHDFLQLYSKEANYKQLMAIYNEALEEDTL